MSPAHTSDEKTKQILQAATTVLAKKGYAGTTISQVATEAGVSRGLLHYYFKNKEEMLAKVVRNSIEASAPIVTAIFRESKSTEELATTLVNALREMFAQNPDLFNLVLESWTMARQSPKIAQELKYLYRVYRESFRSGLEEALARGVIVPEISLEGLASLLAAISDGIWVQMVTEPEMADNEAIWQAARISIRKLLEG
jgi:AcrR family transcriptional regulator